MSKNLLLLSLYVIICPFTFGQSKTENSLSVFLNFKSKIQNPEILFEKNQTNESKNTRYSEEVVDYGNSPIINTVEGFGGEEATGNMIGMQTDQNGNIFTYNYVSGTSNFFGHTFEAGIFICKQNPSGQVIWSRHFANQIVNNNVGNKLILDPVDEYLYIIGQFMDDLIIPGEITLTPAPNGSIFILKYSTSGEFIWAIQEDFSGENLSLSADYSGNIIVSGLYEGQINIHGINLISAGSQDCFLAKYDANANLYWAIGAGGSDIEYICTTTTDAEDNIYLTGEFYSETIFVGGYEFAAGEGEGNIVYFKLNTNADVLVAKTLASTGDEINDYYCWPTGIISDSEGNCYLKGSFGPWANFDDILLENPYPENTYNKFITKIDNNGVVLWARAILHNSSDYAFDYNQFDTDADGSVYFGVQNKDTAYFHNEYELYPSSNADLFVAKYTANGDLDWVKSIKGTQDANTWISSVSVFDKTNLRIGGYYIENITFDTSTIYTPIRHGYLALFGETIQNMEADFGFDLTDCDIPAQFTDLSSSTNGEITNWEWDFGDPQSGENNTSTLQNPSHKFESNYVSYQVKLTVRDAFGNSNTVTKTIAPYQKATISGMVSTSEGNTISSGEVFAFVYSDGYSSEIFNTVPISENGTYVLTDMPSCVDYIIKAESNPEVYDFVFPAYHFDAFYWSAANPLSVNWEDTLVENINILLYEYSPPPSGSSEVSGGVYLRNSKGEPVKNVDVVLEYDDPSEKTLVPVGYQKTDQLGEWSFSSLGEGTFRILVDIPGLNIDSVYTVNITAPNSNIIDLNYYIDPESGVYTDETGISEIQNNSFTSVRLFPNPSQGSFIIDVENQKPNDQLVIQSIEIYNLNGQLVQDFNIQFTGERFSKTLNIKDLETGIYMIKVSGNDQSVIRKLSLMK